MRKLTLPLLTLLLSLLAVPPAAAQSFSGFLRGLTNSFSGGSNQPTPAQNSSATATIGVRGIQPIGDAVQNATPATDQLKLADTWAASKSEASAAAAKNKLSPRVVTLRDDSPTEAARGEGQ